MKQLFILLILLTGMLTQPLYADSIADSSNTVSADDSAGDEGKPPTEEEEEPDCE